MLGFPRFVDGWPWSAEPTIGVFEGIILAVAPEGPEFCVGFKLPSPLCRPVH